MQLLLGLLTFSLYLLSGGYLIAHLTKQVKNNSYASSPYQPAGFLWLFLITIVAHAWFVKLVLFPNQELLLDFYKVPSLIFLVISLISLFALTRKMNISVLIIALIPFILLSLIIALFVSNPIAKTIRDPGASIHIVLSILAYSLLTIGATQAIILAIQEHLLKKHALKGLFQYLPPLQTMDKLLFEIILYGFIFLTLSIVSGFFFLESMFAQHLIHKTLLSLLAWCIFACLIAGHTAYGWRGITAAKLTLFGFAFLMLAYFGSKFALEIILQRQ